MAGAFRFLQRWTAITANDVELLEDRDRELEDYLDMQPQGVLGYAQVTAAQNFTVEADLTNLSVAVSVGESRRVRITAFFSTTNNVANGQNIVNIKEGVTFLNSADIIHLVAGNGNTNSAFAVIAPTAGLHTYKLSAAVTVGAGTGTLQASATRPAFILVEDIGRAT